MNVYKLYIKNNENTEKLQMKTQTIDKRRLTQKNKTKQKNKEI